MSVFLLTINFNGMKYIKSYIDKVDKDTGEIHATASTESEDRDGDVIKNSAWDLKNFKKNAPLLWSHDATSLPVGKVTKISNSNGQLEFKAVFAEEQDGFAAKVARMVRDGFLNAFSVGFIPHSVDEKGHIDKAELLEISVVNVPANQEALLSRAYKSFQKDVDEVTKTNKATKSKIIGDNPMCKLQGETQSDCFNRQVKTLRNNYAEKTEFELMQLAQNISEKQCSTFDDGNTPVDASEVDREKQAKKEDVKKSPSCRASDETKPDCVARKIPEIIEENPDMKRDQVVAIANSICDKTCEDKDIKKITEEIKNIDEGVAKAKQTLNTYQRSRQVSRTAKKNVKKQILQALRVVDKSAELAIVLSKNRKEVKGK